MRGFTCGRLLVGVFVAVLGGCVQAVEVDPAGGVKMTRLGLRGFDPNAPGHALYQRMCAVCHDQGVARAPNPRMLQFLSTGSIYRALTRGVMQTQAAALTDQQKRQVAEYITKLTGEKIHLYGSSSGGLRAGLFAQRNPKFVKRLALDAFVWTGEGSPTLAERKKRVAQYRANNRRPIDREMVRSIFTRDHPGTSDLTVVEAFADAVLALDSSVPTGPYLDMSANLPVIDPLKLTVPTLIMRGQWDGIASFQDLANFFAKLPNPDKQFIVMPGIAHTSTRSKNWRLVYHLLEGYFGQPDPAYTG